ncbi:hypothetical protein VOLCADRAFT_92469 [Volvox carteri f. nagariensis]|uniref:heme oxygenase (biliverdin-producing) n=1 Tax=Volvox carteri f. nagariensis TaxID=3068 RepID=D8TZR1_VOLCA|nr:uncharacterized protein VOLCADRAFT_92469 [Volvox carteri f. nagariensis]EFJ47062.1 hypothetical protein VOLCADRAFT_92469 [Volvox carteri f. nagariensis]|eukprot:XP_002951957.1 hypothetical protein VOLCADRAFT_92469 [Volvox carteri f. nagariensis]
MMLTSRIQSIKSRGCAAPNAKAPRRSVRVVCHGHGHGHGHGPAPTAVLTEKDKGFIAEMRKVAMKLHTKEQAPKEGGKEVPKQQGPWTPTLPGYLRFLTESKAVYDTFERLVLQSDEYAALRDTGLERSQGLSEDIAWYEKTHGLKAPQLEQDGPGLTYCRLLEKLAAEDPPAFICHYYNFYFAHTAGGRMIGNKVAAVLLDGHNLEFYRWSAGDVNELLERVRKTINVMAEGWSHEARAHCLDETEASFKYSGVLLRCITATE